MKVKTSITLSEDVLAAVDQLAGTHQNRSAFIEAAVRAFIADLERQKRNARDLEIINRCEAALNEEALDVLSYQVIP
jgi:metal-responsive CopG/Arc/MetJ family transcriptional regulator